MRAGNDHLRTAPLAFDLDDQGLGAVAALVVLAGDLLFLGKQSLGAAQVDHPAALVAALHDAADNFAHAVLVFVVDDFLLGVAHTLDDDLLGGLGGDTAQILDLEAKAHFIVELDRGIRARGPRPGKSR